MQQRVGGRSQSNMPSRFLKEIPEDLMESHSGSKRQTIQPKAKPTQNVDLVNVQHHLRNKSHLQIGKLETK